MKKGKKIQANKQVGLFVIDTCEICRLICAGQNLTLFDQVFSFDKRNGNKLIGRCADIIKRPVLVILRKDVPQAISTINGWNAAIFPIEKFYAVMQRLFLAIDGDFDFDVLLPQLELLYVQCV